MPHLVVRAGPDPTLQDLLREPEAQQLGAAAAPAGRRWYFERLELQVLRCNLTVIPRAPGAREQARPSGSGSTQRASVITREGTCCLAARLQRTKSTRARSLLLSNACL
jgi:hypothetical protein